jgi:hypothetical protein
MQLGSRKIFPILLIAFLTATITSQFAVEYPRVGVDPSWIAALSEATDSDRIFGKDVVFTFGPLHQAYTSQISENLKPLMFSRLFFFMLWAAIQLFVGIALGLIPEMAVLIAAIAANADSFLDALFYLLPLLCIIIPPALEHRQPRISTRFDALIKTTLLSGVLVSTLVKMSFVPSSIPAILSILGYQLFQKTRSRTAMIIIISAPILVLILTWFFTTRGSVPDLITFYLGLNRDIVLGYSEAMSYSISKPGIEKFITYILISLASLFLFWKLILEDDAQNPAEQRAAGLRTFTSLLSAVLLMWVVAKSSFVRDDQYHVIHATVWSLGFLMLIVGFGSNQLSQILRNGNKNFVFMAISLPFVLVGSLAKDTPSAEFLLKRLQTLGQSLADTRTILFSPEEFVQRKHSTLESIRSDEENYFIPTDASADIISDSGDVTSLIANQVNYSPRPIFQSYSAYTKRLQSANHDFFIASPHKPEYLVVDITKDPFVLDMPALLSLHHRYLYSHRGSQGSIVYRRISDPVNDSSSKRSSQFGQSCKVVASGDLRWNNQSSLSWTSEKILLPKNSVPLVFSFDAHGAPFRKFLSTLYRPLHVKLEYLDANDKPIAIYVVSPLTGRGILVRPLVDTNDQLLKIIDPDVTPYAKKSSEKPLPDAASFRFTTTSLGQPFKRFSYQLYQYTRNCAASHDSGGSATR